MASYKHVIRWIAENDDTPSDSASKDTDYTIVTNLLTVLMVADLWNRDYRLVTMDVIRARIDAQAPAKGVE